MIPPRYEFVSYTSYKEDKIVEGSGHGPLLDTAVIGMYPNSHVSSCAG